VNVHLLAMSDLDPEAKTLVIIRRHQPGRPGGRKAASRGKHTGTAGLPAGAQDPLARARRLIRRNGRPLRPRSWWSEMNLGQYVREIQRLLPGKQVRFFGQMNGDLIKPEQIQEVIDK
jgi:hypothetical protein